MKREKFRASKKSSSKKPKVSYNNRLNDDLIDKIINWVEEGLPADAVCDMLSISVTTFWLWRKRGELYLEGNGEPEEFEKEAKLVLELRRATAMDRYNNLAGLKDGGKDWTRFAWLLERRDRKNYAKNDTSSSMEEYDPDESFL